MTLNNTNLFCYSSGSQKSKMNFMQLKLQCWQGWFFLEAMGGGGDPLHCLLSPSFCGHISFFLFGPSLFTLIELVLLYLGPTWLILDNLPISRFLI